MKTKILICVVLITALLTVAGCAQQPVSTPTLVNSPAETLPPSQSPPPTPTPINYELYSGNWVSDSNVTRLDVLSKGGKTVQFMLIYGKQVVGNYINVSELDKHEAARVDFKCEAAEGKIFCDFTDDGFGNKGTITIVFGDGFIDVTVESQPSVQPSATTAPVWGIGNESVRLYPEKIAEPQTTK